MSKVRPVPYGLWTGPSRSRLDGVVARLGVVNYESGDGGFGIHHEPLRQLDADLLSGQQAEDRRLVRELRARRVSGAVALSPVPRLEPVGHRQVRRIGQVP